MFSFGIEGTRDEHCTEYNYRRIMGKHQTLAFGFL